jgi:HK97 family phage portal protein
MGRIAGVGGESRAVTLKNPSQWLLEALGGGTSFSGQTVNESSAMSLVPVASASSLVASAVGSTPLKVYDRADRSEASATRQWRILHDTPNDEMAADELWELVAHHLLMWGNSFLLKDRDEFGVVQMLWPLSPSRMQVGREPRGSRAVRYFTVDGEPKRYYETDILHIRGLGSDGLIGYSVIQNARQQMGNMLAQDEFSGNFWGNGTFMGAALTHPGEMSEQAQLRLRKQMARKQGVKEAGGIWVFEEDMKYAQLGMPLRDAMWYEQAQMSDLRVAQMFGLVPPHRWGQDSGNLTYANTEVAGTEFVRWTGRRWWTRIEKSLKRDEALFSPRSKLYPEFLAADLMRGDTKTRYETYAIGVTARILTRNEARAAENLPPVEGGDEFEEAPQPMLAQPAAADSTNGARSEAVVINTGSTDVFRIAVDPQPVTVNMPAVEEREITVHVEPTPVNVAAPDVFVNVEPTPVTIENNIEQGRREVDFKRDVFGRITSAIVEDDN